MYLAALGLSCGTGGEWVFDFHCGISDRELRHVGSLVIACGIQFPEKGWNHDLCIGRVLATGPQGSPLPRCF